MESLLRHNETDRKNRIQEPQGRVQREDVGNQRRREYLERQIGNTARNIQLSVAVLPAVEQNRDAKQR